MPKKKGVWNKLSSILSRKPSQSPDSESVPDNIDRLLQAGKEGVKITIEEDRLSVKEALIKNGDGVSSIKEGGFAEAERSRRAAPPKER
jgi:hypothetical protein